MNRLDDTTAKRAAPPRLGVFADERGATAIEYALLLGLICLVIIAAIGATGDGLSANWNAMASNAASNLKSN